MKLLKFRRGASPEAVTGSAQPEANGLSAVTAIYRSLKKKNPQTI